MNTLNTYVAERDMTLSPPVDVYIKEGGRDFYAGILAKRSDGYWFATSPYDSEPHIVDQGGMALRREDHARWYLELCARVSPLLQGRSA
jgi:hypothetical protein